MLEILQFIFQGPGHFIGTLILLALLMQGIGYIITCAREK